MRRIKMKKAVLCIILACFFPAIAFPQNALTIDAALNNSTSYFSSRIPANTKVVVLNFSSKWPDLSDYIIEELMGYIVNEGKLTVVDRQNLETIRREMDFQLSGEVSDETAQSIGKKLGAQTIISGSITAIGNTYRLRVRAISVETAQIPGMQNVDVAQDSRIAALTGTAYTEPATVAATATAPRTAAATSTANTPQTVSTANTPQTASTVTVTPANANFLELATAGWKPNFDPKSTVSFTITTESIEGREREVLIVNQNLSRGNSNWAEVYTTNETIVQKLTRGSRVRFKVLGDGKAWELRIQTKETSADSAWYYAVITTRKDRVVEIDIPYSKLKQPNWGRKIAFNKNSIMGLNFARNNESQGGSGASAIKIFDLEVY
jgi:TolB-like protein